MAAIQITKAAGALALATTRGSLRSIEVDSEFEISPLGLDFDGMSVSNSEEMIPAEHFPFDFGVIEGESYPKQVVKYHIPFSGDWELLRIAPNPRLMNSHPVSVENGEVCFEIIDFYGDPERIKPDAESALNFIRQQAGHLEKNIAQYNEKLRPQAESLFDKRKAEVMKQNQVMSALGVPVKKSKNVPDTFAVPAVSRKKVVPRPTASTAKYEPEPILDQSIYDDILKAINDTGHVWERLPSTYAGKDEETLRDHLIMVLEPRFEIPTTGEKSATIKKPAGASLAFPGLGGNTRGASWWADQIGIKITD